MIIRHGEPSSLDHAEYGIMCKTLFYNKPDYAIYVQTSKDESNPVWCFVGEFNNETENTIDEEVARLIQ